MALTWMFGIGKGSEHMMCCTSCQSNSLIEQTLSKVRDFEALFLFDFSEVSEVTSASRSSIADYDD